MNFLRDDTGPMHGSVAGEFDTTTGFSPTAGIRLTWPGGGSTMPTDSAADSASGIQSQLIIALVLGGIMLGVLGLLGYLLFRNAARAKDLFIDFMSFEMLLALEVCLEVRCMAQCTAWRGSMWPVLGGCGQVWDICGDCVFVVQVHHHRDKPWLQSLYIPYIIVFILAASVSLLSVAVKGLLFVGKLRTRAKSMSVKRVSRLSLGGVQVGSLPEYPGSTPDTAFAWWCAGRDRACGE